MATCLSAFHRSFIPLCYLSPIFDLIALPPSPTSLPLGQLVSEETTLRMVKLIVRRYVSSARSARASITSSACRLQRSAKFHVHSGPMQSVKVSCNAPASPILRFCHLSYGSLFISPRPRQISIVIASRRQLRFHLSSQDGVHLNTPTIFACRRHPGVTIKGNSSLCRGL